MIRRTDDYGENTIKDSDMAGVADTCNSGIDDQTDGADNFRTARIHHIVCSRFWIFSLFTRRWSDLFVLALIGAGVFILMFVLSFIQETCNTLIEKIRML